MGPGRKTSPRDSNPGSDTEAGRRLQRLQRMQRLRKAGVTGAAKVHRQQNADKTKFYPGLVGVCLPPASGIAPIRVRPTVNVHPPCPVVNTPLLEKRRAV